MMISLYYECCTKIFDISSSTSSHIIKAWSIMKFSLQFDQFLIIGSPKPGHGVPTLHSRPAIRETTA